MTITEHITIVKREAGRYWTVCEVCGLIASSQTQKAVMEAKAAEHQNADGEPLPARTKPQEHARRPVLPARMRIKLCAKCSEPLSGEHWHSTAYPVREVCCSCAGHVGVPT